MILFGNTNKVTHNYDTTNNNWMTSDIYYSARCQIYIIVHDVIYLLYLDVIKAEQ